MSRRELLAGCGNRREKYVYPQGRKEWEGLVTLDIDPNCKPDIEWDLERMPLPFPDDHFDELHFYHILEHVGRQGDWKFFFDQFSEFWRILKPGGIICSCVPPLTSRWLWGDPGHTRAITIDMLTFLDQKVYIDQVGHTALADYRHYYKADFNGVYSHQADEDNHFFIIEAVKPSRIAV